MNLEKNKEDELFLEFLNSNPGARQLYNLVLQQDLNNGNPPKSPRSSVGSVGARASVVPGKSPSKNTRIMPIGKSPSRSNSSTSIIAKSPAKQQQSIAVPIGKSPKKATSVANLKPITPNRKTWTKVENGSELRSVETQNIFEMNYANSYGSVGPSTTPTKSDRALESSIFSELGANSMGLTRRLSLKTQLYTPMSKPSDDKENDVNRINFSAQSKPVNNQKLDNVKYLDTSKDSKKDKSKSSKKKDKDGRKSIKESNNFKKKGKKELQSNIGPPPPNFIPLPPQLDAEESKTEPHTVFNQLVNIWSTMDFSPKIWQNKSLKYAFMANQLIDWLIDNRYSKNRQMATQLCLEIQRLGYIDGVTKGDFKDSKIPFILTSKGRMARSVQASQYFIKVFHPTSGVELKDRYVKGKSYKSSFTGGEFVDWILDNKLVSSRDMAMKIGKEFLDCGLIEHMTQDSQFKDDKSVIYGLTRDGAAQRTQPVSPKSKQNHYHDDIEGSKCRPSEEQKSVKEDYPTEKISNPRLAISSSHSSRIASSALDESRERSKERASKSIKDEEKLFSDSDDDLDVPPLIAPKILPSRSNVSNAQPIPPVLSINSRPAPPLSVVLPKPTNTLERVDRAKGPTNRRLPTRFVGSKPSRPSDEISESSSKALAKSCSSTSLEVSKPQAMRKEDRNQNKGDTEQEIINIPDNIVKIITDEVSLKCLRQYLVKNCKFQELDFINFLSDVYCLSKESNSRNRTVLKREIYKTFISETSTTFLPLPIAIKNNIQSLMDSQTLSNTVYAECSAWVSDQIVSVISDYIQTQRPLLPTKNIVPEKKEVKVLNNNDEDCFIYNLDFCFAVSSFKVNYLTKSTSERMEEVNTIVSKFLSGDRPKISIMNTENLATVLKVIKTGSFKIDVFDKLISDVAEVLNATTKVTDDKKPSPENKPIVSPVNPVLPLEPLPLPQTHSNEPQAEVKSVAPPTPSCSVPASPSKQAPVEKFSIVLRRFNKRGGVRIPVPDTMKQLLELASEKLKITAVRIREVETEAELSELSLLKPDMLVWVMTPQEELEFV